MCKYFYLFFQIAVCLI